jgi:hypothetical protein
MPHGGRPRWLIWWTLAEHAAARTSLPRTDIARADADIERAFAHTGIGRAAVRFLAMLDRAWTDSRARRAIEPVRSEWTILERTEAVRAVGAAVTVAAAVSLALQALEPTPVGPLSWLLPTLCAAAGIVALALARPIVRIVESRHQ